MKFGLHLPLIVVYSPPLRATRRSLQVLPGGAKPSSNMSEINVDDFKINEKDTGSTGFQVAVLTKRIAHLTQHLAEHKHDHASRRGLLMMVSKRRSLLNYAKRTDNELYLSLLKRLSLRH